MRRMGEHVRVTMQDIFDKEIHRNMKRCMDLERCWVPGRVDHKGWGGHHSAIKHGRYGDGMR